MKQIILKDKMLLDFQDINSNIYCDINDVVIKVKVVTICGSDISYFKTNKLPHNLAYPLILGHEVSGIVIKKGSNVSHLEVGDRVAIEPDQYCGKCQYCKVGEYNFCESLKFMASKGEPGALKEFITWNAYNVYKISDSMTYENGALLEPLSVAYSAIKKLNIKDTSHIAVLGAGSIGILIGILLQSLYPNASFHLIDIYEEKKLLGIAAGVNENHFLITNDSDLKEVDQFTDIIDTTGEPSVINEYINKSMQGANIICIGVSDKKIELSCKDIVYKGIHITGSYRYANTYQKLIDLISEKHIKLEKVITSKYEFFEAQKAFEQAMDTKHNIKVSIMFS